MRSMIGGKTINDVQVFPERVDIFLCCELWSYLSAPAFSLIPYPFKGGRVRGQGNVSLCQEQVMRADLTRDFKTLSFRSFDEQHFFLQRDVRNMDRPVIDRSKQDCPAMLLLSLWAT